MRTPIRQPLSVRRLARDAALLIELNRDFGRLKSLVGDERARLFWDVQDRVAATLGAAERDRIEAVRDALSFENLVAEFTRACADALRTDGDLLDAFDPCPEAWELGFRLLRKQVPAFLLTRVGQSLTLAEA